MVTDAPTGLSPFSLSFSLKFKRYPGMVALVPALEGLGQEDFEFEANLELVVTLFQNKKHKPEPQERKTNFKMD